MKEDNPYQERKDQKNIMITLTFFSLVIGIGTLIFYISIVTDSHSLPKDNQTLNLTNYGAFGDFIGGVIGTFFSLAGIFLLFLTLRDQRDNFDKERFENNFFEMVKFHRENVNELQFSYYETKDLKVTSEKRKVFKIIHSQFKDAWLELSHFFENLKEEDLYEENYLNKLQNNLLLKERKISLFQLAKIDIIYSIVFFGVGKEDIETIKDLHRSKYNPNLIIQILNFASLKPKRESDFWDHWSTISGLPRKNEIFNDILEIRKDSNYAPKVKFNFIQEGKKIIPFKSFYPDSYFKYYGGHQFRLGHYFRHLYQTVKFINEEKYLSDKEKYKYVKILRGQLSNYEQIIILLNSLSTMGRAWEIDVPKENKNINLITNYALLKNIPRRHLFDEIDIINYYPNIRYEIIK